MNTTSFVYRTAIVFVLFVLISLPADPALTAPPSNENIHIVLVHGFGQTGHDMRYLATYFRNCGYDVSTPTLPAFFGTLESCTAALESHVDSLDQSYSRIHFAGHSLGGLVIRNMLSRNDIPRLGRCVLIGTPNSGTPLAEIVEDWIKPLYYAAPIFSILRPDSVDIPPPVNTPAPEIGVIAGDKNSLLPGNFIDGPADGLVPLDSVPFDGMAAFIVLHYHHKEIHHKDETARLVREFLETGVFLSKEP